MIDVVLAAVLVVCGVVGEARSAVAAAPWAALAAGIWMAPMVLRTAWPLGMAIGTSTGAMVYAAVPCGTQTGGLWSFVALLVMGFTIGQWLSGRTRVLVAGYALLTTYVLQIVSASRYASDFSGVWFAPLVLVLAPVTAGALLSHARRQSFELRVLTADLAQERQLHVRAAAAEERNRIARELHDVIAHSVSVMVVQAGAAEHQLPPGAASRAQLVAIRRTGQEALAELRRQLGVLRDSEPESSAPLPSLVDVRRLAADNGAVLDLDAGLVDLPAGFGLTVFRVVQEALTNARRHAVGAAVRVRLARADDALVVEVVNGRAQTRGPQHSGGHGLVGMQERVAMLAGELTTGPTPDGGFEVRALLPLSSGVTQAAHPEPG